MNLFEARTLVAIAESSKKFSALEVVSNSLALSTKSTLVSIGLSDVSKETSLDIVEASKSDTIDAVCGLMLRAFWRESISAGFKLHNPSGSRLMINPPEGLHDVFASGTLTGTGQNFLIGKYGDRLKNGQRVSSLTRLNIRQDEKTVGCFDEIVIFWDYGIDIVPILDCVSSGTVVILACPDLGVKSNSVWVTWAKFDAGFEKIASEFNKRFKTQRLNTTFLAGAAIRALGIL